MLLRWSETNSMAEPLPTGAAELLPAAIASMEARLSPIGREGLAVRMQRLWDAGVPQPEPVTIAEWMRLLSGYPQREVEDALDEVAKSHRWPSPPTIADVMKFLTPGLERLSNWRRTLTKAEARAALDAKAKAEEEARKQRHAEWMADRLARLTAEQRGEAEAMLARVRSGASVAEVIRGAAQSRAQDAR